MKLNFLLFSILFFVCSLQWMVAQDCSLEDCISDKCGPTGGGFVTYEPTGTAIFCENGEVTLENQSTDGIFDTFQIDWGDGNIETISGYGNVQHVYNLTDLDPCEQPEQIFIKMCYVGKRECSEGETCNGSSTNLAIKLRPVAEFNFPSQVCIGESASFIEQSCNSEDFLWNFGDGETSTQENPSHTFTSVGIYNVCLSVENTCSVDQTCHSVKVVNQPDAAFDFATISPNNCAPAIVAFTNQSDLLNSAVTWLFQLNGSNLNIENSPHIEFTDTLMTVNTPNIEVLFKTPGEYTITQRANNACDTDELSQTITIISQPTINLQEVNDQCDFPYTYSPSFNDSGDIATYSWQFTGGNPSSSTSSSPPNITYSSPGTYTIEVSVTNACGTATDTQSFIIVDPQSGANLPDQEICLNAPNLDLDSEILNGNWEGTGVNNSDIFIPSNAGVGTHELSYTETIGNCQLEGDLEITVKPLPTIEVGGNFSACVENGNFSLPQGTPTAGAWTNEQGNTITTALNPVDLGIGNHIFTFSYTDPTTQCSNSDQITVEVFDIQINLDNIETNYCNIDQDYNLNANVNVSSTGQWSSVENSVTPEGTFNPSNIPINPDTNTGTDVLTYTVTHQDCTDSQQITVNVVVAEEINAGENVSVCPNAPPIALNDGFPSGGTWLLNGNPITEFVPSSSNVGQNQLTYVVGSGNCEQTDTRIIEVFSVANISLNAPSPICLNESPHQFSATPTGGTWSGDFITSNGTFDPSNAGAGSYQVTYTFTDDKGCEFSQSKTIEVEGIPTFDAPIVSEACVGDEVAFVLEGSNLECTWTFEDGVTLNGCNQSRSFDSEATYSVTLEVSTQLGCKDELTQNIFIAEPPIANFTEDAPNEYVCTPLPVNIQNMSGGYNALYTFDFGNGESLSTSNPDTLFTYIYEGAYIVSDTIFNLTLTVENPCGVRTTSQEVRVKPSPNIKFGPKENEVCSGTPLEFNNKTEGNPETFFWDFGDGTTSTEENPPAHPFFTGENDTTYTITLIASNECNTDTMSWEILVKPKTVKSFFNTHPTEGCAPLTVQFENLSTDASNILFSFEGGNVSNADNPTHTFEEAGTYEVLLAADNGCAFDSSYQTIEVFPAPQIEGFDMPTLACINEPTPFGAIVTENISNYLWKFGDGDSSTLTNPIHAYSQIGTYEVSLTIVSAFNECPNTFTIPVEIVEKPIAGIEAENAFGCSPLTVDFQNVSQNAVAYQWSMGDGGAYVESAPQHTFTSTVDTTFIVTLVAINSAGCKDSTQFLVPVTAQPTAAFVASEYSHCDAPVVIDLTNESEGGTSYEWWINGILEEVTENASVLFSDIDDYLIELVATNPFGCRDTAETVIRVVPQAIAELPTDSFAVCEGQFLTFPNSSTGTHFVWDLGDGTTSMLQNPSHAYALEGSYDLSLIASFDGLCPDTLEVVNGVEVSRSPVADFTYVNIDDPVPTGTVKFSNSSQDAIYYFWDFGDTQTSEEAEPTHRYDYFSNKLVTLIAENSIGCFDTARLEIELTFFKGLHVPNAFTPDLGPPDVREFLPKGVNLEEYEIRIYDKWNGLVFVSTELNNGQPSEAWDGTHIKNGEPLPQGAYAWEISAVFSDRSPWEGKEYKNDRRKMVGSVMLIR